jgi:peroxiredoxin Q/BCP
MKLKSIFIFLFTTSVLFSGVTKIGDTITSFSANDENGHLWNLQNNLDQKYLVVYFYPAALTGG